MSQGGGGADRQVTTDELPGTPTNKKINLYMEWLSCGATRIL